MLDRFIRALHRERGSTDRDLLLGLATLQKRALSSAWSLERSVARRLEMLSGDTPDPNDVRQGDLPFGGVDDELDDAETLRRWNAVQD